MANVIAISPTIGRRCAVSYIALFLFVWVQTYLNSWVMSWEIIPWVQSLLVRTTLLWLLKVPGNKMTLGQISLCSQLIKEFCHFYPLHILTHALPLPDSESCVPLENWTQYEALIWKAKRKLRFQGNVSKEKIPKVLVVEHNASCIKNSDKGFASGFSVQLRSHGWGWGSTLNTGLKALHFAEEKNDSQGREVLSRFQNSLVTETGLALRTYVLTPCVCVIAFFQLDLT